MSLLETIMSGDGPNEAAQKVTKTADDADGGVRNPRVVVEISNSLTQNNNALMNDQADRRQFAQRLEDNGLLPALAFHQLKDVRMSVFGDGKGNLSVEKLREAATAPTSPANKLLAMAIVDRLDKINTDGNPVISLKELQAWAGDSKYLNATPPAGRRAKR